MDAKRALPHTIAELITAYNARRFSDEMQALDRLLRQLVANWDAVVDSQSMPSWDYPLTIPAGEFLARAMLTSKDVDYIARITDSTAVEPVSGVTGLESDDQLFPTQRWALRQVFQDVRLGLTTDMVDALRTLLPSDSDGEFVIRPMHLPALQVLHLLLLRSGYWPKQLQDAWLNVAEAGYDPTAVPPINDETLRLAHTNREGELIRERPPINDIATFYRASNDEGSEAYGDRLRRCELALMLLATLASSGLAAFNDAYWHYVELLAFS